MIPEVVSVAEERPKLHQTASERKVHAFVRLGDLSAMISVSVNAVAWARMGVNRQPFLTELSRELCRVGMHHGSCCYRVQST